MALFTNIPRLLLRRWNVASSIFHGVDQTGEPQPLTSKYRENDYSWKLQTDSAMKAAQWNGTLVEPRTTHYGDLYAASSNLTFKLMGSFPGEMTGDRHYDEYKQQDIIVSPSVEGVPGNYNVSDGWIDVRSYTKLSLVASATGSIENFSPYDGEPQGTSDLDFDGQIRVEYRNYIHEPTVGTIMSSSIDGPRHTIIDPLNPLDISGIGWFRVVVVSNQKQGPCAVYGTLKS